jgi:hypothetical protein
MANKGITIRPGQEVRAWLERRSKDSGSSMSAIVTGFLVEAMERSIRIRGGKENDESKKQRSEGAGEGDSTVQ